MTRRGWVLFLAMGLLWGIPYLLIKVAVRELEPTVIVFGRTLIGAAVLLPVALARGELRGIAARWRPILAFSAVEMAVPWLLMSGAEEHLASSVTGLLVAGVPLVGLVVDRLWGSSEPIGWRRMCGLVLGLVGVAALVGLDPGRVSVGPLVAVGVVVIGYATGPRIIAHALSGLPALGVVTASVCVTALAYLVPAAVQWPDRMPRGTVLLSVVGLGLACTALAFLVFFGLVAEVGAAKATVVTYVNPAVAVALGCVVLGEPFTAGTGLGFALVLAGSLLATRASRPSAAGPSAGQPAATELSGVTAPSPSLTGDNLVT